MPTIKKSYQDRGRTKEKNSFFGRESYEKRSTELKICLSYDLNGNIQALSRNDQNGNPLDDLSYTYNGNQLATITDTADKTEGFIDGVDLAEEYTYDANGNLTINRNKGIASIEYNHLNLPEKITKDDGSYLKVIYDANRTRLAQEVYDQNDVLQKRTDYVGEFIYEQEGSNPSELAMILHDEGRIVPNTVDGGYDYQYKLTDYQGNTRVMFTTNPKTHNFGLNYESDASLPDDESSFENMGNIIDANIHDVTDAGSTYTQSQKLTGADGAIVGSVLTIPVGKGDQINATVSAKYLAPTGNLNNATNTVAGALIGALSGNSSAGNFEGAANSTTVSSGGSFVGALGSNVSSTEPMAFINLMFLSEDATEVTADRFSYGQISAASSNAHAPLSLPEVYEAPSSGYVVVYLSNESDYLTEVYFDELQVTINESKVIQTSQYYPYGAIASQYNRITTPKNRYLHNEGTERIDDLELNIDLNEFRTRDAWDGSTWWQIDPLADQQGQESWTPYHYSFSNPIKYNDKRGLAPEECCGNPLPFLRVLTNPDVQQSITSTKGHASRIFDGRWGGSKSIGYGIGFEGQIGPAKGSAALTGIEVGFTQDDGNVTINGTLGEASVSGGFQDANIKMHISGAKGELEISKDGVNADGSILDRGIDTEGTGRTEFTMEDTKLSGDIDVGKVFSIGGTLSLGEAYKTVEGVIETTGAILKTVSDGVMNSIPNNEDIRQVSPLLD